MTLPPFGPDEFDEYLAEAMEDPVFRLEYERAEWISAPHSDKPDRPAVLIAERDGWRCPVPGCTHRQAWAFATMAGHYWEPVSPELLFGAARRRRQEP